MGFRFQNSYQTLDNCLFEYSQPKFFKQPHGLMCNASLAQSLQIDLSWLASQQATRILCGNETAEGSTPIHQAYAGHQFGNFAILGDGRATLLGEHQHADGKIYDVQLKGSGRTPYSRSGDGQATLAALLKEYIYSEAMHALSIPSTRSLAIVGTGEWVQRQKPQPGAVLTRIAASHLRIGTFQFAQLQDIQTLKELADYAIQRHDPELIGSPNCYLSFLEKMMDRSAQLVALWMSVGFVHGVMNTDNISIAGETMDYGPCAFIDEYDLRSSYSFIDRQGRYAFGNQPHIMHWNLCRFAESLLPLINPDNPTAAIEDAQALLKTFSDRYQMYWQSLFCQKIGFSEPNTAAIKLVHQLLDIMSAQGADFTKTFSDLTVGALDDHHFSDWQSQWEKDLKDCHQSIDQAKQLMSTVNPVVILRNHVLMPIIDEAEASGNLTPFIELLQVILQPFSRSHHNHALAFPRPAGSAPTTTFCGT